MKSKRRRQGLVFARQALQDLRWQLPLAGLLLFMPPLLGLFDRPVYLFGLPLILFYLFFVWTVGILLTALVSQASRRQADKED